MSKETNTTLASGSREPIHREQSKLSEPLEVVVGMTTGVLDMCVKLPTCGCV
jgi:hypothetical protein